MPTLLILMILGAMGFAFWSASRAAAEQAILLGGDACRTAGVQLIDHTVHATGLRLRRGEDGRHGMVDQLHPGRAAGVAARPGCN